MKRRIPPRIRATQILLALLLLIPPGLRLALTHFAPADSEALTVGGSEALRHEMALLRDSLRQANTSLALCNMVPLEDRYHHVPVEILPLGDPSPSRSVLWGLERGNAAIPPDSACVYPVWSAGRVEAQALVGRVIRTHPSLGLVGVQTLLDPGFRVKFRYRDSSGMLCGTGRHSGARPILEIRHLAETSTLEVGEPVFTEGNDGVYPAGALIGYLERREPVDFAAQEPKRSTVGSRRHFVVRAALSARNLKALGCVVDLSVTLRDFISDAERRGERR